MMAGHHAGGGGPPNAEVTPLGLERRHHQTTSGPTDAALKVATVGLGVTHHPRHDRTACRTCSLWWVPWWSPDEERLDPWGRRVDYAGLYVGEAA
jgi:hypothetical protein